MVRFGLRNQTEHMARATSLILLICGSLLLVTWLVSPASSAPQTSAPQVVDLGPLPAELADVNAQLDRLKTRLDRTVDVPVPSRDPFHFAARRSVDRPAPVATPSMPVEMMAPPVLTPSWPTLVAILTAPDDGSLQAALSDRDETMYVVSVGGVAGAFTVTEIAPEAITVTDPTSGQSTRLSLR